MRFAAGGRPRAVHVDAFPPRVHTPRVTRPSLRQGAVLVLGLNFWGAAAAAPVLYGARVELPLWAPLVPLVLGPAVLVLGAARARAWALLAAFPALVALAAALGGRRALAFGPITFATVALCFVAYCLAAATLCRPRAATHLGPDEGGLVIEPLADRPAPHRWRLRLGILRTLTVGTALFPVVTIAPLLAREGTPELLPLACILPLWVGAFVAYLRAPAWAFYIGADEREPSRPPRKPVLLALRWLALAAAALAGVGLLALGSGS